MIDFTCFSVSLFGSVGINRRCSSDLSYYFLSIIRKVKKAHYEIVDIFLNILLQQNDDAMVSLDNSLKLEI